MKKIILAHLQKLNETDIMIIRDYNNKTWSVHYYNGGSFEYTYNDELIWNGLVYPSK